MKHQKSCRPRLGKLVHQLPDVITFAYDFHFRHTIAYWKDLSEEYKSVQKFHDEIIQLQHTQKNVV
jgi:hypothetical protein